MADDSDSEGEIILMGGGGAVVFDARGGDRAAAEEEEEDEGGVAVGDDEDEGGAGGFGSGYESDDLARLSPLKKKLKGSSKGGGRKLGSVTVK